MSGGGKGVSSALALSNAITNLAASAFGEQRRLEPMPADRKARWRRELGWLISVADHIVEFAPTQQTNKDGSSMEVMTTRQRTDLLCNVPALKKLDAMLLVRTKNKNYYINLSFYYNSPKILTFFLFICRIVLTNSRTKMSFTMSKKILLILQRQEMMRNGGYQRLKSHLMASPRCQEGFYRAKRNVLIKSLKLQWQ